MRKLLLLLVIITITQFAAISGHAQAPQKQLPSLKNDGLIAIYNFHENEYEEIRYRDEKGYDPQGLKKIAHIMRSRGDGGQMQMDTRLIEILDNIQDHFGAETIEIISGYRSPAYNDFLRDNGRGAARESLHKQGLAADIHIDEVCEARLHEYVKSLGLGGAGLYPRYYFVHVDVGEPRTWSSDDKKGRELIGTGNNPNASWSAVTDQDLYKLGDSVSIKVTNNGYGTEGIQKNIWLDGFRKGKWSEHVQLSKGGGKRLKGGKSATFDVKLPDDARLGKYRLVFFTSSDFSVPPSYSNEFYIR